MCGLFGAIGNNIVTGEVDRVMDLGTISTIRGYDSSGAIFLRRKNQKSGAHMAYHKTDLTWPEAMQTADFRKKFLLSSGTTLTGILGHTRAATVGSISAKNAHPFHVGNVIGMHNGTCSSLTVPEGSTDSKELYKMINEKGISKTVDRLVTGDAAALVWVDIPTSRVHIWRNYLRTLYYTVDMGVLYYASEAAFLQLALGRKNSKAFDVKPFDTETLYTFDIGSCSFTTKPLKKEIVTSSVKWSRKDKDKDNNIVPFKVEPKNEIKPTSVVKNEGSPLYYRIHNILVPVKDVRDMLNKGCSWCCTIPSWTDKIWWFDRTAFVCNDCFNNDNPDLQGILLSSTVTQGALVNV